MTASKSSSHFPSHARPRVWFIASSASEPRVSIAREALTHGDFVVCGEHARVSATEDNDGDQDLRSLMNQAESEGYIERLMIVRFDAKYVLVSAKCGYKV